jgi:hypothetical protein
VAKSRHTKRSFLLFSASDKLVRQGCRFVVCFEVLRIAVIYTDMPPPLKKPEETSEFFLLIENLEIASKFILSQRDHVFSFTDWMPQSSTQLG